MDNNLAKNLLEQYGGLDTNDLQNHFIHDEDEDNEPQILKQSAYIDLENIEKFIEQNKHNFNALSMNIESANSKFDELITTLQYLKKKFNFLFSAIFLQECWLQNDDKDSIKHFEIPGYKLLAQKQQCSRKGGLMAYIHNEFTCKPIDTFKRSKKNLWEAQHIEIKGTRLKNTLSVSNIYRPPRENNGNDTISDFVSEFEPFMAKIMKKKANHMFLGDFNLNLLHLQQREKIQEYLDKFLTRGLIPRITLPTRFSKKGCTLIDQIYCKFIDPLHESSSAIFVTKLSDHFPCLFSIRLEPKDVERAKFIEIQKFTDKNIANYENEISSEISDVREKISNEPDADKGYEIIEQFLQAKHNKHFPVETVRFNRYKHKIQPWIEFSLMKSIKKRDKFYKDLKKTHHSHPDYEAKKQNLMTYNKILKSSIRDLKQRFYHAEFAKYTGNMKMTWRTIGIVMSKKAKKDDLPQYFLLNETKKVVDTDGSTKEINVTKK